MGKIRIICMKKIAWLLLFSFTHCFTVFTKDETILESEKLETKEVNEERDVYILTQSLTKDGLYLLLDAYRVKEENSVNVIKEKYQVNKDFKWNDDIKGSPGAGGSLEFISPMTGEADGFEARVVLPRASAMSSSSVTAHRGISA